MHQIWNLSILAYAGGFAEVGFSIAPHIGVVYLVNQGEKISFSAGTCPKSWKYQPKFGKESFQGMANVASLFVFE